MKALWVLTLAGILCSTIYAQDYGPPIGNPQIYKSADGTDLHVWVTEPSDKAAQHPAIVFFHGGGWTGGFVAQFNRQTRELADRGMVVFDVEYRLIAKAPSNESPRVCVEDAKSAMRWVRSHAHDLRVDPSRIVSSGGSAGGYLAAAVALVPEWNDPADDLKISPKPEAVALFFPVLDITPEANRFAPDTQKYMPMEYLTKDAPPTIIEGGGSDKLVKPETLEAYKAKCDAVHATCVLHMYPGQGHGFANRQPYTTLTLNDVIHFLIGLGYLPKNTPDVSLPAAAQPQN